MEYNNKNHLIIYNSLSLCSSSGLTAGTRGTGLFQIITSTLEFLAKQSGSQKLSTSKQFSWQNVMAKSSRRATFEKLPMYYSQAVFQILASLLSSSQRFRHSSMQYLMASTHSTSDLVQLVSQMAVSFLSLLTRFISYSNCFLFLSQRDSQSASTLRQQTTFSSWATNQSHPSKLQTLSPSSASFSDSRREIICLVAMKRSPRQNIPLSSELGRISMNRQMNLIRLICAVNCFSVLGLAWTFLRWCSEVGSRELFQSRWFEEIYLLRPGGWGGSWQLVCFRSSCGMPSSQVIRRTKGWLLSSLRSSRFVSSLIRHLRMKSFRSSDRFLLIVQFCLLILSMSYFQVEDSQGAFPCSISYRITPRDQISFLTVQMLDLRASGLMYRGLPTFTDYLELEVALLAKPKSAILATLSLSRILAGLRSLCRNPDQAMTRNPLMMSRKMGMASASGSFSRFLRRFSRSPSLQNSVIIQQLLTVLQMSWHLSMFRWFSFLRASIQPSSICRAGLSRMDFRSITLMATCSRVLQLMPRNTLELKPFPIKSVNPQEQSSIFFLISLLLEANLIGIQDVSNRQNNQL